MKLENVRLQEVIKSIQASRNKVIEEINGKLKEANGALSKLSREKRDELKAANREIDALKLSLQSANEHESTLCHELTVYQLRKYDSASLEDCQKLLLTHLERAASIQKAIQRKSEVAKCVVCLVGARKVLLLPCAHLMMCEECAGKVNFCPICRAIIATRVPVHGD